MSLSQEELHQHCIRILSSRRIHNKIIVLCEGSIPRIQGILSPQSYRGIDGFPDANFYKACIPRSWRESIPEFFNCGDRNDVLNTYFSLLEIVEQDANSSYFHPKNLFAIVDSDHQVKTLNPIYPFGDTEAIFHNLYDKTKVNKANAERHHIWVTGFIHKECYFLIPELQEVFDQLLTSAHYKSNKLLLEDIYLDMARGIIDDADLVGNFQTVCNRISHCNALDIGDPEKLKNSWKKEFQSSSDEIRKKELIFTLLAIRKAKAYWHQIEPDRNWTGSTSPFRDQLLLKIGGFYAEQADAAQHHIPYFLKLLRELI